MTFALKQTAPTAPTLGKFHAQREIASPLPINGRYDAATVQLDEIENKVIHSRTDLIQSFAGQDHDIDGRLFEHLNCFFAVRLNDDFTRLVCSISDNAVIDSSDVFLCPVEFAPCGLES